MASYKVEVCLKKKKPTRAQIFRYFRIESRNNKNQNTPKQKVPPHFSNGRNKNTNKTLGLYTARYLKC